MDATPPEPGPEARRRQRARNWAILAALVGFVVIIYLVTIVKITGGN